MPINKSLYLDSVEPDFIQTGAMYVQMWGRINAAAPDTGGAVQSFPAPGNTAGAPSSQTGAPQAQQVVYFREGRREMRIRFGSNVQGGNYQCGQLIGIIGIGDGRMRT
jgi:hypothetical protein